LTRVTGNPSQVQTSFYARTTIPGAVLLALLVSLVPFVSWKGETGKNLAKSSVRSLLVAGAGLVIALVAGAREPTSLVVMFVALFAADMNLRAVVRKARGGKLGGAGGYLAHVGVGVMLAGIVISGVYARSTRATLPVNEPVTI